MPSAGKEDNRHYKHGMYQHCIYSLSRYVFELNLLKHRRRMEMIRSLQPSQLKDKKKHAATIVDKRIYLYII